jgi:hypothetical protein
MTTTTEKKTIKVTLSERRPVTIDPDQWPVIASAKTFFGGSGHACQANEDAWIKVRQHEDGRVLVYCDRDSGPGGMQMGYRGKRGGFLLVARGSSNEREHTEEIVRAIRRCAGIIDADELGDECIADLPAEEL